MIRIVSIGQSSYEMYIQVEKMPEENEKLRFVNKIGCGGGCASNVAYLLGKWGASSTFAGVVGNDVFGNRIKKELESVGVDTRYIEVSFEKDTNLSLVLVKSKELKRTVINVADEYVKLKKYDFDFTPDLIFVDGHDAYASKQTIDRFPKAVSIIDADRYTKEIEEVCLKTNYIVCSLNFATNAVKMPVDVNNVNSLVSLYSELRRKFEHQTVIVTLGERGAMYAVDDQIKISPALKMNSIDKTGSGDIFSGAFCYGIASKWNLEKSIKFGNIAAGLSTEKIGTRLSVPKLDEVTKIYEKIS